MAGEAGGAGRLMSTGSPDRDTWNPTQYEKFEREREQPYFDLLALIRPPAVPSAQMRVVDLGCGTGKLTRVLHSRLQAGETIGIDQSGRMLESRGNNNPPAGLRFEVGTIESFPGNLGTFDLILSNAAYHWVPDHETLLGRLTGALRPGGQLAFQVPYSHRDLFAVVAAELAATEPFGTAFGGWKRLEPVLEPEAYARLLYRLGFSDPIVRLIVYPHILAGPEEVVEWSLGTLLTEYTRRLSGDMATQFIAEYRTRLLERLEPARPFFFPFKRVLCWGQRA
jgi:trans-aconitate 2-methyltransferase